ncbi:MAG: arginine--tRNA ligase [Pirellulales bacterium]
MQILNELKHRFEEALAPLAGETTELVDMVRLSQDPKFGDYQANCAMPLAKQLGRPPRDVAAEIVSRLDVVDLCEPPEIAGPGFINLRLRSDWLAREVERAIADERLGVAHVAEPRMYLVDYSAPNVAKPMHVGHIRSTVIGDALYRTLVFLGHRVVGDNHLGDWGTQFGMILYGYKHFVDRAAYEQNRVGELARLYRLVRQLVDYHDGRGALPQLEAKVARLEREFEAQRAALAGIDANEVKQAEKSARQVERALAEAREELAALRGKLADVASDPVLERRAAEHPLIGQAVLQETARLHEGDAENVALWREFLPACMADIERIYRRLQVKFDEVLGESFYHNRLARVVADLETKGLARESGGATCVFLDGYDTPMIVRKQDGAFLYATTDLATIQYRIEKWQPHAILYVVDHRQSRHFGQLFAAARAWGYRDVELAHVNFGTVLGEDGRPFKTRAGETVGLEALLDEAVERALKIVTENDETKPTGAELSADERRRVAEAVGIGAIKYADLSQNRTSDYTFSYDKMLAMQGNTATYMQYAHARIRSIFARGEKQYGAELLSRATVGAIRLGESAERALAVELLRFAEALEMVVADYRPNHLTSYLFELAGKFSTFYEECPVLRAETPELVRSRLLLCDVTARVLKQGLNLLGIEAVERM